MADDAPRLAIDTEFTRALRQDQLTPEVTRPVAAPVDTFANPHAGEQLTQLANALGQVAPEVAKYGDVMAKNNQEGDKAAAEMAVSDAMRNGAKTYADAVQSGAIPASASPWYRLYAKNQMGRAMAANMGSDFEAASRTDLAGSTDLQSFDQYAQKFQQNWLKEHGGVASEDPALRQGFDPEANRVMANARDSFANTAGKNLENQTFDALSQNQAQTIRLGKQGKLTDQQITDQLNLSSDAAMAHGMNGAQVNAANAKAITDAATNGLDSSILGLGKLVKAGTGTLQDTGVFSQLNKETGTYIVRQQMAADTKAHEDKVRSNEDIRATNMTTALNALTADPQADIRPQLAALTATQDYSAIESLTAHQNALQHRSEKDDSVGWTSVMEDLTGPHPTLTRAHLSAMIANGDLTPDHAHTASTLMTEQEKAAQEKSKSNSYTKDPLYRLSMNALRSNFQAAVGKAGILNPTFGKATEELDSELQEMITSPEYLKKNATARRAEAASLVQTATDNANLTTSSQSPAPALTIKAGQVAQQAHSDTTFAKTLQTERATGSFSPATITEIQHRGLLTAAQRQAFILKMGANVTPQPTP
jgi:hypothetical protein